jgi:hypothetical protein
VSPDELEDASSEFNAKVQIVSRPPDQIPVQATPTCRWSSSVGAYIEGRQL